MNTLSLPFWFNPNPWSGLRLTARLTANPLILTSFQPPVPRPVLQGLGWPNQKRAIVMETISPEHPGWVKCEGIWWQAMGHQEAILYPQTSVTVIGRDGLTLIVEPRQ